MSAIQSSLVPSMSNELMWYTSRASGVVAVVLLTVAMVLGMVISVRRSPASKLPAVVMALHRWLALGMVVFLIVHIVTAIAETYVNIGPLAAVVPFISVYEPVWIGLGALAVDLLLAVLLTSWLGPRISQRTWKTVHWWAYVLWPLALVHAWQLGTADEPLLRSVSIGCAVVGGLALLWRMFAASPDQRRRREVARQDWA